MLAVEYSEAQQELETRARTSRGAAGSAAWVWEEAPEVRLSGRRKL